MSEEQQSEPCLWEISYRALREEFDLLHKNNEKLFLSILDGQSADIVEALFHAVENVNPNYVPSKKAKVTEGGYQWSQ